MTNVKVWKDDEKKKREALKKWVRSGWVWVARRRMHKRSPCALSRCADDDT